MAIDSVHREAITRLVALFKDGVLEQVIQDPAIRTLMEMYDLLPTTSPCAKVYDFLGATEAPGERGRGRRAEGPGTGPGAALGPGAERRLRSR
jgi:hypothetical protein